VDWDANFVVICDLNLFAYTDDELEAVSVYNVGNGPQLACISKGCPVSGTADGEWLLAELTDGSRVRIPLKFVRPWVKKHAPAPDLECDAERPSELADLAGDGSVREARGVLDLREAG
jgi:hypothetical protein